MFDHGGELVTVQARVEGVTDSATAHDCVVRFHVQRGIPSYRTHNLSIPAAPPHTSFEKLLKGALLKVLFWGHSCDSLK